MMETYKISQYGKQPEFASFLPGIAGEKGIPIWCYYVNRGQGVVSFGINNKDHAIMEYLPAHRAYTRVRQTGFRTFLRKNGAFRELFTQEEAGEMTIGMNTLSLAEEVDGLKAEVTYFVLPEERVGALVRCLTLTNTGSKDARLEVLDGMPELVPYGVTDWTLKNMLQTGKAWMQAEDTEQKAPYFRVRASMEDTAGVTMIEGGNFAVGFDAEGRRLDVVTDPQRIFAYELSLERPVVFNKEGLEGVFERPELHSNLFPCAFFAAEPLLMPGESFTIYELIGQVERHSLLEQFLEKTHDREWFEEKQSRAVELTERLTDCIDTHTADPIFDAYSRYTYMDNVLRGGTPVQVADKTLYVYSRKHGDLERDYNYYSMLPEFYSQGNGNYRDVAQNRRNDTFFSPFVGKANIRTFYDMIQIDGYNPLSVEMQTYTLKDAPEGLAQPFTPGRLYARLMELGQESRFEEYMEKAEGDLNARFGEGYWCDHWTYNLDLVEEYLDLYPDKKHELLYTPEYTWFLAQASILPRARRYEKTAGGIRQLHSLEKERETKDRYLKDAKGQIIRSTLMEKLIVMCAVKFAALDAYGLGIEMEGGKPGWYDALNGLPGLVGSSMAETYELDRMMRFVLEALEEDDTSIDLPEEAAAFLEELVRIDHEFKPEGEGEQMDFWNRINDAKEAYRARTYDGLGGERHHLEAGTLAQWIGELRATVRRGIETAMAIGCQNSTLPPTYFYYDITEYTEDESGLHPVHMELRKMPAFLEGIVRLMKLDDIDKKKLYEEVKNSQLYDAKLGMYRVNAPLDEASYEIGRCRAFTPGWLENGSIWLHMEYKYFLELIKADLDFSFARDFLKAAIPFLDPAVYGRSTLENSSFLASSLNPNPAIHGRGFVARLSGSTAEFLSIWRRMMFGNSPFWLEDGELVAYLAPLLPGKFFDEKGTVSACFMGHTQVVYHGFRDCTPLTSWPELYEIEYVDGTREEVKEHKLQGSRAEALRDGRIRRLDVYMRD